MDYKKYSLENLENWLHDAMSAGEATPQEIYDVIVGVAKENYYIYKQQASQAYELLALLNSGIDNSKYQDYLSEILSCDKDDPSPECKGAWNDFWDKIDDDVAQDIRENGYEWTPVAVKSPPVYVNKDGDVFFPEKSDRVVKWQLPVELDGLTGECYVNFPDDLLEAANLKEGDTVQWIDNGDGTYTLKKV